MELPGQHIAELRPSDPFGAAAAFPWPLRVHRSQALSPASRGACSPAAPHQPLSPCPAQPFSGGILAGTAVHSSCAYPVCACSCVQCTGNVGSDTRDLVSCGGGKKMWGEEQNGAPQLFSRQQRIIAIEGRTPLQAPYSAQLFSSWCLGMAEQLLERKSPHTQNSWR